MSLFGVNNLNLGIDLSDLTTGLPTTTTNVTSVSPYESGAAASSFYGSFPDTTEERQPLDWWDVEDPAAYFGVKGERTEEQQARARQFREEWGNVRGGAVLNGLIDGTYTADQVNQYWGAENFSSQIKASEYSTGEFSGNPDDFGAYLQAEWDAVSGFMEGTAGGPSGELGSLTTAPTQGLGGAQGQGRGVRVSADVLAQQNYVNSIRAAASDAGVPTNVISPDGAHYELNFGQFDDVGLGEYKQTKEPYGALDIAAQLMGEGIKIILQAGALGGVRSLITDLTGLSSFPSAYDSLNNILSFGNAGETAGEAAGALETLGNLLGLYQDVNVVKDSVEATVDQINDFIEIASPESTVPEDVVIPEDELDAAADDLTNGDEDLLEGDDLFTDTVVGGEGRGGPGAFLTTGQEADFNSGKDVVLDDGRIINNETHEQFGTPGYYGGIFVRPIEVDDDDGGGGGGDAEGGATESTSTTESDISEEGQVIIADVGAVDLSEQEGVSEDVSEVIEVVEEAFEEETDPETKKDLEEYLEDLEEFGSTEEVDETVEVVEETFEEGTTAETTEEAEGEGKAEEEGEEEDDIGLFNIPLNIETDVSEFPDPIIIEDPITDINEVSEEVQQPGNGDLGDTGDGIGDLGDSDDDGLGDGDGTGEGEGEGTGTGTGTGSGDGDGDGDGSGTGSGSGTRTPSGGAEVNTGQGYMGGLSYQIPQFVGVQYQPKDYTVELNRIINESLFKGMI